MVGKNDSGGNFIRKHLIVYQEPGRFGGWPANNGIWSWGNEILVGFERAYYQGNEKGHSIVPGKTAEVGLARSLDGGETWILEEPGALSRGFSELLTCPGGMRFGAQGFAMKCFGEGFFASYDRGRTWLGPYSLPGFDWKLTSRTDYLVCGEMDCLFFLSAFEARVEADHQDRAFCARTMDGGKTFKFLSWMTDEPITVRSVMPSTVQLPNGHLISAMRRKVDVGDQTGVRSLCWIDVYRADPSGQQWKFLSRVADTGDWNGNPPALIRLQDGRLCITYGYRRAPFGIRAKLSVDEGATWGEEINLREDGRSWDLGYPRMVQRSDGRLVVVYYFTTSQNPVQHIAATIWDP